MRQDLEQLEATLGRPLTTFPTLATMRPDEIERLLDAIERSRQAQGRALDAAVSRPVPWPLRGLLLRWLSGQRS